VGYFLVSRDYADVGKFITPTLRELKFTAPYMHNGALGTLVEVVEYYDKGGSGEDVMPVELHPLGLSKGEKKNLVAFLEALSSETPVHVERMTIPQDYEPIENWLDTKN
jgi:cytochrome c peroxidase